MGAKTTGRNETTWVGVAGGERFVVRISPRLRVSGESFLTGSNHRLRDSHLGSGGYFLDVEVLDGPTVGSAAEELAAMVRAVDEETALVARPVRVRAKGARFRTHLFADDGER